MLARVAAPSPYLREKTVDSFDPLAIPGRAGDPSLPAPVSELTFDVAASPWRGDLGLFLRERMPGLGERVRVRVKGTGIHASSPIRIPSGTSLEIRAEPSPSAGGPSLVWSSLGSAAGEALIEVHGGTLILSNVGLVRDGGSRLDALVRVEDGHLVAHRCRLISSGAVETGGGGLVAFRAATSRPLEDVPGPFGAPSDLPSCRLVDSLLISGGDAISAEVARGVVALEHCAVAAGGDALTLLPMRVARHRFQADLWLDRCTLVAGRGAVALGPWPGEAPGPDRPWLVSTQGSAFLDGSNRIPREGVLLRVDPEAFARGLLFWQAINDAYEVGRFLAASDDPPSPKLRPDVRQQWVNLWGANHIRDVTGPSLTGRTPPAVRTLGRLRPGEIVPGDLVLDPSYYPGRKALDVGADPRRLGLPTVQAPRRR
jgi:serine/threonine-protein kinase